jgi:hypothetical protein
MQDLLRTLLLAPSSFRKRLEPKILAAVTLMQFAAGGHPNSMALVRVTEKAPQCLAGVVVLSST